jgi:hypothetical protein
MANIVKKGEGKYLIRVSRGTGKERTFINKTFRGSLADARRHAREIESAVDTEALDDFKTKLIASLSDPLVAQSLGRVVRDAEKRSGLTLVRNAS